jgi:hypothetical protein
MYNIQATRYEAGRRHLFAAVAPSYKTTKTSTKVACDVDAIPKRHRILHAGQHRERAGGMGRVPSLALGAARTTPSRTTPSSRTRRPCIRFHVLNGRLHEGVVRGVAQASHSALSRHPPGTGRVLPVPVIMDKPINQSINHACDDTQSCELNRQCLENVHVCTCDA